MSAFSFRHNSLFLFWNAFRTKFHLIRRDRCWWGIFFLVTKSFFVPRSEWTRFFFLRNLGRIRTAQLRVWSGRWFSRYSRKVRGSKFPDFYRLSNRKGAFKKLDFQKKSPKWHFRPFRPKFPDVKYTKGATPISIRSLFDSNCLGSIREEISRQARSHRSRLRTSPENAWKFTFSVLVTSLVNFHTKKLFVLNSNVTKIEHNPRQDIIRPPLPDDQTPAHKNNSPSVSPN